MRYVIMYLSFPKETLVASDSMEHLESRMSGAQQLEVTVSGARSDVEQMKEIPGVKSCEITREISEEVMESDDDETPGTDTEQITLQSEEKTTEADNSETQRVDAEETTQSETDVSENENPEETSAQKNGKTEWRISSLYPGKRKSGHQGSSISLLCRT